MDQEERPESSSDLAQVHVLIWIQSVVGVALSGAFFLCSLNPSRARLAAGFLACTVPWMVSFVPIRRKARAIPLEHRVVPAGPPRWAVVTLLVGQCLSGASVFFSPWSLLILPANIVGGAVILLRWLTCNGLDLPIEGKRWEAVLVILACGTIGNFVLPFIAHSLFLWH